MTPERRAPALRPYFGLAGVTVTLAAMFVAMELVYRVGSSWGSLERFASPPLGILTALVLAGWSALVAGRSGLSGRAWIGLGLASGLAAVAAGLTYSTVPDLAWAIPLQIPSAILLLAALALGARQTSRVVAEEQPTSSGRASLLVFVLATIAVAGMEVRLWHLLAPTRDSYTDMREEGRQDGACPGRAAQKSTPSQPSAAYVL